MKVMFHVFFQVCCPHSCSAGDDWDELERKAAKSDLKRADGGRKGHDSDESEDDRPKKKPAAANGKSKNKGHSRR
jgi:hypothetical protein